MKKPLSLSLLFLTTIFLSSPIGLANFKDVPKTHQYFKSISTLQEKGCVSGYADKSFKPENKINRAETLKLILTCLNLPKIYTEEVFELPKGATYSLNNKELTLTEDSQLKIKIPFNPKTYPDLEFLDLNRQAWYIDTLKEALVREIITGYADRTIKAERTVGKGEFFTMLYRVVPQELRKVNLEKDIANDALIGQWYTESLGFAVQNNLIGTDENNNLNPFRELNRAQVAHFINLYYDFLNSKTTSPQTPPDEPQATQPTDSTPTETATETPTTGFTEQGVASFMGKGIAGRKTASGDTYNPEVRTAAHNTIPFGSLVKVTNTETQKWVTVLINDRGPNQSTHPDRIIDLSYRAFEEIAEISQGLISVTIEVLPLKND